MDNPGDSIGLVDDAVRNRFVIDIPEGEAFAVYRRQDRLLIISHTEVPASARGQGLGSRLTKAILDRAREEGRVVVPACSFVADWVRRHPEYRDVVSGLPESAP